MCGLSGWKISPSLIESFKPQAAKFTLSQNHRGPDSTGSYHSDNGQVYLGHNRLSIIDLSDAGNQPMYSANGDVMILNGEIYNYRQLKHELEAKGHQFKSQSDTEVVLKSFLEWGMDFTDKIQGMYAIVIWRESDQSMHLLRDPLGIKPLYYWTLDRNEGIVFASELRSFLALDEFETQISSAGLNQYIEFGYSIDSTATIFDGVKKLQPGHRLEIRGSSISRQIPFYLPDLTNYTDTSPTEIEDQLYEALNQVIKEHLVADVPVGLLLSGGLDSSLIAAIASKHEKIHTYSMGFANSQVDERPFARTVSEFIGSHHHEVLLQPNQIMQDIESVSSHFDDLFADWGLVSTRLLYKTCRDQGIKVVLVGEGSDELFGGYGIFRDGLDSRSPMEWRLFQLYRKYIGQRYGAEYFRFRTIMLDYLKSTGGDLFKALQLFESRNQLPNNYVMKVDKASMSVSVEARTPFLDSRIANIAYRIPKELLIDSSSEKKILKSIATRYKLLPDEIINRKKYGAGIAANWIDEPSEFRNFARDTILANNSWVDQLGLRDAMQRYFDDGQAGYAFPRRLGIFRNIAWRILILNLWGNSLEL